MSQAVINGELFDVPQQVAAHINHIEGMLAKVHQMLRLEHEHWGEREKQRLALIARIKKEVIQIRLVQKELF